MIKVHYICTRVGGYDTLVPYMYTCTRACGPHQSAALDIQIRENACHRMNIFLVYFVPFHKITGMLPYVKADILFSHQFQQRHCINSK
jgi:hypothetical protein